MISIVLAVVLGYLFGSIPWALIVGKIFYKKDIRQYGSGNLGGTNAGRVLGKKAGVAVTVLDALKAFFVVMICYYMAPKTMIYGGLACCFGHCFPIFAGFKGGKAVATTIGFILAISVFIEPHFIGLFVMTVLVFFVSLKFIKMVSVCSLLAISYSVMASFVLKCDLSVSLSLLFLLIFVTYRHKENLKRVKAGTEKKITWM